MISAAHTILWYVATSNLGGTYLNDTEYTILIGFNVTQLMN